MKKRIADKTILINSLQAEICSLYNREAKRFQHLYNSANPTAHIWRKMLYTRVFCFLHNGDLVYVKVELVRFISAAVSGSDPEARFYVSAETFFHWKSLFPASSPIQDHNSTSPASFSGVV